MEVSPDYIFVKPMPEISLDYFLPIDVYGDDPHTVEIDPIIPYSLGVQVSNNGFGTAWDLKIESAQPEIVENELGLLIGFKIEGSEVNGEPATPSLLVDFGDIAPNSKGTARWLMTTSLSGKFIDFEAEFTHADELGGELTSLISAVNTHTLVGDVVVDLPGRDLIRDFLAEDAGVFRVYESDAGVTEVPIIVQSRRILRRINDFHRTVGNVGQVFEAFGNALLDLSPPGVLGAGCRCSCRFHGGFLSIHVVTS